jgi:hypothetical protein
LRAPGGLGEAVARGEQGLPVFEGLEAGLAGVVVVARGVETGLRGFARVGGEAFERGDLGGDRVELFGPRALVLESLAAQRRIDVRAGELFEEGGAFVGVGADQRLEIALREQDRAGELLGAQADDLPDGLFRLGIGAAEVFGAVGPLECMGMVLDRPVRLAARAPHGPARAIGGAIGHSEIDFGIAFAAAVAQDRARVAGGKPVFITPALHPHGSGPGPRAGAGFRQRARDTPHRARWICPRPWAR